MARQATGIVAAVALAIGAGAPAGAQHGRHRGRGAPRPAAAAPASTAPRRRRHPAAGGRHGRLRIAGDLRDGGTVTASGLTWRPGRLPAGDRLLSFEVAIAWQACRAGRCSAGADSTATPFAARRYVVGHADAGRRLRVTETATEVVQTRAAAVHLHGGPRGQDRSPLPPRPPPTRAAAAR